MENENKTNNKWGKGIPNYTKDDVMDETDLYKFGLEFVYHQLIKEGYSFIQKSDDIQVHPSLVMKKDDQLYFIFIETAIARKFPHISDYHRFIMIKHAKAFKAIPMYAPISFGSSDGERFNQGLALKDDSFFVHYEGLKLITDEGKDDVNTSYYMCELLTKIGEGYINHNVDKFIKYIDDEARWYSPYSQTLYTNKKDIREYYYNKFILIDEDKLTYFLCYDPEQGNKPLLFLAQDIKQNNQKTAILIDIEINDEGKIVYIKIKKPSSVKYKL